MRVSGQLLFRIATACLDYSIANGRQTDSGWHRLAGVRTRVQAPVFLLSQAGTDRLRQAGDGAHIGELLVMQHEWLDQQMFKGEVAG